MASDYRFSHGSGCIQINFLFFMKGNTWKYKIDLGKGIQMTYEWFRSNSKGF